jgi:putative peptidoglycan binding protein
MLSFRASLALLLFSAVGAAPALASRVHKVSPSSSHAHLTKTSRSHKGRLSSKNASRSHIQRGQKAIEPARVTEIQQALIREHYLNSDATGQWDSATQAAMQKYQADQGWQTKLMPDSRALKKLGLGADYSTAINARTSSFSEPPPVSTIPANQAAGFAAAAGTDR